LRAICTSSARAVVQTTSTNAAMSHTNRFMIADL